MAFAIPTLITDAGRDAAIAADELGLKLRLTHMALSDSAEEPDATWTALDGEQERFEVLSGARIAEAQLQLNAVAQSAEAYTIRQIGVIAEDGTLFAVAWRLPAGIVHKAAGVPYPIAFDLELLGVPVEAVTVEATLSLDLAFVGPIAALTMAVAGLTQRQIAQEIRLRHHKGRATGGMEKAL